MLEIYNENIYDLLSPQSGGCSVHIIKHDANTHVPNLTLWK